MFSISNLHRSYISSNDSVMCVVSVRAKHPRVIDPCFAFSIVICLRLVFALHLFIIYRMALSIWSCGSSVYIFLISAHMAVISVLSPCVASSFFWMSRKAGVMSPVFQRVKWWSPEFRNMCASARLP